VPTEDKITYLKQGMQYPGFMSRRYLYNFVELQRKYEGLKIKHEPYADSRGDPKSLMLWIMRIYDGHSPLPQFFLIN